MNTNLIGRKRTICFISILMLSAIGNTYGYGKSVEDLVGVFSIEKNIKLGSSAECFGNSETTSDPLHPSDRFTAMDDTQAPSLADLSLMPISAENNPNYNQINITAHIIDDQSGMKGAQVWFRSPSGRQSAEVQLTPISRIYGTFKDGVYAADLVLSHDNEQGLWQIDNITLVDNEGNQRILYLEDLDRIDLTSSFPLN